MCDLLSIRSAVDIVHPREIASVVQVVFLIFRQVSFLLVLC